MQNIRQVEWSLSPEFTPLLQHLHCLTRNTQQIATRQTAGSCSHQCESLTEFWTFSDSHQFSVLVTQVFSNHMSHTLPDRVVGADCCRWSSRSTTRPLSLTFCHWIFTSTRMRWRTSSTRPSRRWAWRRFWRNSTLLGRRWNSNISSIHALESRCFRPAKNSLKLSKTIRFSLHIAFSSCVVVLIGRNTRLICLFVCPLARPFVLQRLVSWIQKGVKPKLVCIVSVQTRQTLDAEKEWSTMSRPVERVRWG